MRDEVCAVIPAIPTRPQLLARAMRSVLTQTRPVAAVSVAVDLDHEGASATRNRALDASSGDWVAFLDDDDTWMPHHVATLLDLAHAEDADFVWGWFEVVGGTDPFPQHRGRRYRLDGDVHCIPITYLVRRDLIMEARGMMGGFLPDPDGIGAWEIQDMPLIETMFDLCGGAFASTTRPTWQYHHNRLNTSGVKDRW